MGHGGNATGLMPQAQATPGGAMKGRLNMAETDLHSVRGWSVEHIGKLAKSWINSADQVVAISVTRDGMQSLAQQLEVSEPEAHRLVALARAALPPEVLAGLEQPFVSDDRGMGALRPGADQPPAGPDRSAH
jgi:hypothetical protein